MKSYDQTFKSHIQRIQDENRYREFVTLSRFVGNLPYAVWHHDQSETDVVVWCTNDYLGMSHHPHVIQALKSAALNYGAGSGGTRNISGTTFPHVLLENQMARLHKKESALLFGSGYAANEGTLSALARAFDNLIIFSDEKNHASQIQGIRNGGAERKIFPHNDMDALEQMLKDQPYDRPKLVVVVSVYSMLGDFAPLQTLCDLCERYNALLYVDEVHAVGLYGEDGSGRVAQLGLTDRVDIIQGNFAKGYGVIGGYIAAKADLVDYIRLTASAFIFTTSLPPAICMAALASVQYLETHPHERAVFWQKVTLLKNTLDQYRIPYHKNDGHIVPIIIGDAKKCRSVCFELLHDYYIYTQPINYPTVAVGSEMIRLVVTPYHTDQMIVDLCKALSHILHKDLDAYFHVA